MQVNELGESHEADKKMEIRSFLMLTVVLAPVVAVAIVGGLGFAIWIFQIIAGPPGPPA